MEQKKGKSVAMIVLIVGIILGVIFLGIGVFKQNDAKKINQQRYNDAYSQSEANVKRAEKRMKELNDQYDSLESAIEEKARECDSIVTGSEGWFERQGECDRELLKLEDQHNSNQNEYNSLKNADYTVYYQKVKPINYLIFYIIGGSIILLTSLSSLLIYIIKEKK